MIIKRIFIVSIIFYIAACQSVSTLPVEPRPESKSNIIDINNIREAVWPKTAIDTEQHGWVLIGVKLSKNGTLEKMFVISSSPKGMFDKAVLHSLRDATFIVPDNYTGAKIEELFFSFEVEQ